LVDERKYRDVAVLEGGHMSCELDAIRPNDLREMVRKASVTASALCFAFQS
jgi:hypothetical protein